ncbi:prefoldin subunit [Exidia glandulosa HHB12029]|uniref:Prefoldin subunit 3 n=1 Tax=Exidia glandulosa HHB12029 TaxID=1314781 RepID=A0A165IN20_EXIGL|nr:prefoldin subunit [Exidia glandulosa HHB12029]KZV93630.1 prefoldin subunit [Exidia glandulosa HHB12029]
MALQAPKETNPRGIPRAPFVSDVAEFIGGPTVEVENTLKEFQEAMAKYKYMEQNLAQRRTALQDKIPDIRKTLAMVQFLQQQRQKREEDGDDESTPIRTTFELNETLYAEADIPPTDTVYLWLGANVMLAYKLNEAAELLESKKSAAEQNLAHVDEDLEFLREQQTVMEVNTARVYNWDVRRRRLARQAAEAID